MPIRFSVWLEGVLGNAEVISDKETLKRVWLEGDQQITSMTSFDEAYVQLFDDLDALGYINRYTKNPTLSREQQRALHKYIEQFRDFDDSKFSVDGVLNVELMLDSPEWDKLESSAKQLVELF